LSTVGFLGDFARGHALFSLYRLGPDQSQYPNGPCEYLVDCDDGVGPHEVCRFSVDESERSASEHGDAEASGGLKRRGSRPGVSKTGGSEPRGFDVTWRGAWNGDQWCGWIMGRARDLINASGDD
jgi:hypothetical protein